MKIKIYIIIVFSLISLSTVAQTNELFKFVVECDSLYKFKKYSEAIDLFEKGQNDKTDEFKYRMNDYYFIACCYAQIGDNNNAFKNLFILLNKYDYSDTSILRDTDLNNIKNDERWNKFRLGIVGNQKINDIKKSKYVYLKHKLDSLYIIDQIEAAYLNLEYQKKFDKRGKDSINKFVYKSAQGRSKEVSKLLKNTPWLNKSILGVDAFDMIFLSAQHSGDVKKMKNLLYKYKKNRRTPVEYAHYAMLYDKIQLLSNRKQRYGTQLIINLSTGKKFYHKIEDFNKVNEYRKYCYYDTIQENMQWHNMLMYEESTQEEQKNIK